MKRLFLLIIITTTTLASAQQSGLSLQECVALALNEQPRFRAEKIRAANGLLDLRAAKSERGPQVSLTYAYRYNAIIPTSLVPTALTDPGNNSILTDDFTELQFGTLWQQDVGISLFQPLFDKGMDSKIEESRINEQLGHLELQKKREQLIYEVIETYLNLSQKKAQLNTALIDTLRTYKTLQLIKSGYEEGRLLKPELNTALINHNNSKSVLSQVIAQKDREYAHLGFLIGYDTNVSASEFFFEHMDALLPDMIATETKENESIETQILKINDTLLAQKIISRKRSRLPTVALDAFWGANQFNQDFIPFEQDTWFGNSFVGVSLNLPILSTNGTKSEITKLKREREIKAEELLEETNRRIKENKQSETSVRSLQKELRFLEENVQLRMSSLAIYQVRFSNGKANAYQINEEELLLQKSSELLHTKRTELWAALLKIYKNKGRLKEFLN